MREHPVTFAVERESRAGYFHCPSGRGPFPAVLFLHGLTGNKAENHRLFVTMARALAAAGMASFRFDFRGHGDSGGEFSQMTVRGECADARAALRVLMRLPGVDASRIGLLGMSMGGMIGMFTLAAQPRLFKAAAFWNAVSDPVGLRDRRMTSLARTQLRKLGVADNAGWPVGAAFLRELDVLRPLDAARQVRCPSLFVIGTNDQAVPIEESLAYRDVLAANAIPTRLHAVKGADHVFSSLTWTAEALGASLDWFIRHLR